MQAVGTTASPSLTHEPLEGLSPAGHDAPTKKRSPVPMRGVLEVEPEVFVVLVYQTDAAGNDTLTAYDALERSKVSGTENTLSYG